jgi:hypothetical protein
MRQSYVFAGSGTQKTVSVNGQPLQLKRRKSEHEGHISPDCLALSTLSHAVGDDTARLLAHTFQQAIVNNCEAGEEISSEEIAEWVDFECQIGVSVQSVGLTTNGTNETALVSTPLRLPRLLRVQKL